MVFSVVDLPAPLWPKKARIWPGIEREGHVVDHRAIAVTRDEILHLQQHQIAPPK